jgi:hypothetical protein|eukprot:SAG25_NODE_313_length_9986_cov_6.931324_8_plen_45_part_00
MLTRLRDVHVCSVDSGHGLLRLHNIKQTWKQKALRSRVLGLINQ